MPAALRPLLIGSLVVCSSLYAQDEKLNTSLREAVHSVPVAAAGASVVVTTFRPSGEGPYPWVVYSHGTPDSMQQIQQMGRNRSLGVARQWVQRGYAVLVLVRRGYGASGGGAPADSYGSCRRPDFRAAGEAAALDLLAVVEWAQAQPDLDGRRWLLLGQSSGGYASIYAAAKRPAGLIAVLAFAPGRGARPNTHPGETCAADMMAGLLAELAPRIAVPVLWFYAENDEYVGPRVQKLWFERFRAAGGRGELVVVAPFPDRRGHGVLTSPAGVPLWTAAVAAFFKTHAITLPF